MDRHTGNRRRKEVGIQGSVKPQLSSSPDEPRDVPFDRNIIIIENVDPGLISTAELDAYEHFFDDAIMQALGR